MNREELASALASRLDVPVHSVRVFLHAYFDAVKTTLRSGETVDLGGLGFWVPVRGDSGALAVVRYSQPLPAAVSAGDRFGEATFIIPLEELRSSDLSDRVVVDIAGILSEVAAPAAVNGVSLLRTDTETAPETPVSYTPKPASDTQDQYDDAAAVHDAESVLPVSADDAWLETDSYQHGTEDATVEESYDDIQDFLLPADEVPTPSADDYVAMDIEEQAVDETEAFTPPMSADIAYPRHEIPVEYDRNVPVPDIDVADEHKHEDFSDDDSFNRNRDQLFNPPEKKNIRPLLLVAIVLTAVLIAIILYMTYVDQPERELPGVDVPAGALLRTPARLTV